MKAIESSIIDTISPILVLLIILKHDMVRVEACLRYVVTKLRNLQCRIGRDITFHSLAIRRARRTGDEGDAECLGEQVDQIREARQVDLPLLVTRLAVEKRARGMGNLATD